MVLDDTLKDVKGVGEDLSRKFATINIKTITDLLDYFPRRYEDYSTVTAINRLKPGPITIQAVIKQARGRYARRGLHITEAVASDSTGSVRLIWFNQPYRERSLQPNTDYYISGLFALSRQRLSIMNPSIELVSAFPINTARIIPVYREAKGINSIQIRRVLRETMPLIQNAPESLPSWLVKEEKLISRAEAFQKIHFPDDAKDVELAKRRLGFEEVFQLILASLLNKQEMSADISLAVPFKEALAKDFVAHLPFKLTDDQRKATWQIYKDLSKDHPMNRLLEGDVGSGKTVVATMAALMALEQGYQIAFMGPTEILARQHAETIYNLLKPLGLHTVLTLLVGSMKVSEKEKAYRAIAKGQAKFIIGTQALIQEKVKMPKLALIIIDEQHRFGVDQRKALMAKAGYMPHVLSLTATPIPRSLALTLYGELDISLLATKPKGRKTTITKICSPNSRKQLYMSIEKELLKGRQVFVVCPLIINIGGRQSDSVEVVYENLSKKDFKKWKVGMLHGKMKSVDKNKVMEQFVKHDIDILVTTTVVEVGVDVPNASVMLIESADFFGLAQIHQLRGRVGRSRHRGYCYLMMSDSSSINRRLRALESSSDGFRLAELDLDIRGPGAIYGTIQHGSLDLRIAQLNDTVLITKARKAAIEFIDQKENLLQYSHLAKKVTALRAVTNLN